MRLLQTTMTKDISDKTDFIELDLDDSSERKTSLELEPPRYSLFSDTLPPSLILQLSHDMKSSNNSLDMTSSNKDIALDDTKQPKYNSLPENKSRPLPVVRSPYYNVNNESGNAKENITIKVNIGGEDKRPSYGEVLSIQPNSERTTYAELNTAADHYDILAPIQRLNAPMEYLKNPQHNANAASKKCVALSVCCILVALLVVLITTLATVVIARDHIDHSFNTELSSFQKFQKESNEKILGTLIAMSSGVTNTSEIKVQYADSCYCLYKGNRLPWQEAKDFCLAKGSGVHLAEIYTKEENDFLMPVLQASKSLMGIWLGGSDLAKEGSWVWSYTGKRMDVFQPTQWAFNQPSNISNVDTVENCLDVYSWDASTFKWNDHACRDAKPFLCKAQSTNQKCFC